MSRARRPTMTDLAQARTQLMRRRARLVMVCIVCAFAIISLRLVDLSVVQTLRVLTEETENDTLAAAAAIPAAPNALRGEIIDRNGVLLATSLKTASVYVDPALIDDPARVAKDIVSVLPTQNEESIRAKISDPKKRFVWIERNITPRQQYALNALGHPGVDFKFEDKRIYPQGGLTSHVAGYVDVDGRGIAGIEKYFDEDLAAGEAPVRLTLDVRVQNILHNHLKTTVEKFSAVAGTGIVMDVRNGEIIAMVSYPDFDPHAPAKAAPEARFNQATLGVFEMGSTFKMFSVAAALERGTSTIHDYVDAIKPIRIGRFTIDDYHAKRRKLSVPEVFIYSSNIGTGKMALGAGAGYLRDFYGTLGLLEKPVIELPEIGKPLVPQRWTDLTAVTASFGHGIAVSPLQTMRATAVLLNGGHLLQPTLVAGKTPANPVSSPVIKASTGEAMKALLTLTTVKGTGSKALVDGYDVGGKTGTAEKISKTGGYKKDSLLSSFVGAFPMENPRYAVIAIIDEPKGIKESYGYATGGWTAAPVVGNVIAEMAPILSIGPVGNEHGDLVARAMSPYLLTEKKHASR